MFGWFLFIWCWWWWMGNYKGCSGDVGSDGGGGGVGSDIGSGSGDYIGCLSKVNWTSLCHHPSLTLLPLLNISIFLHFHSPFSKWTLKNDDKEVPFLKIRQMWICRDDTFPPCPKWLKRLMCRILLIWQKAMRRRAAPGSLWYAEQTPQTRCTTMHLFSSIFLNWISQLYLSHVFLKCISQLYFSQLIFITCIYHMYF